LESEKKVKVRYHFCERESRHKEGERRSLSTGAQKRGKGWSAGKEATNCAQERRANVTMPANEVRRKSTPTERADPTAPDPFEFELELDVGEGDGEDIDPVEGGGLEELVVVVVVLGSMTVDGP
jgi:hypothetical protein